MNKITAAALCAALAFGAAPVSAKSERPAKPVAAKQSFAAGEPGNPREPAVEIAITMQETYDGKMLFAPDKVEVPVGQQVRFVLTNYGTVDHSFVIGSTDQAKERAISAKAEPNARFVPAAGQSDILWRFSKPGRFEFASVLPGQYGAGMKGTISVGEAAPEE